LRVDFDYLKFKNIGSWGNEVTTIDFSKGVNLISAPNGRGKSFIIEAFVFCLTGKSYRKLKKIKNLINRKNKKGLYTEVGFHIGKTHWKVTRTLSPDTLTYSKRMSDGEYKDIDSLSSKSLDQAEIEKILKIDPFMVKQIVALDVNYNKPFLSLSAAETRAILEAVFNLSIFSKMLSELKTLLAGYEADLKIEEKSLTYLAKDIVNQKENISTMENMITSFNDIKNQAIDKIKKEITSIEEEINEHMDNIIQAKEFIDESTLIPIENIAASIKEKEHEISDLRHDNKTKDERLKLLGKGNCPTCKTSFKGDFNLELEQEELKQGISIIESRIDSLLTEIADLEEEINKANENNAEIREITAALKYEEQNLKTLENKKNEQEIRLEEETNKEMNFDINSVKEKYAESVDEKVALEKKISDLTVFIGNMKDAKKVLSDKGAKAYLMAKFIPLLNSKVQDYLIKFDLNVVVTFNELMQVEIFDPMQPDVSIEYESFSKGEKKRLDMSILLSFIRVTKEICNWHCNVMFLDELLDGGLDDEGLDKVGKAIKSMVEEDELCVYTISHRKLSYNLFNKYLFIEQDKYKFSYISQAEE
jgi:DNA repair exonuclease SbcCD ATPase subunit